MTNPLRIVLVEDNQVFRDALELLLGLRSDVEVVGSLAHGEGVVGSHGRVLHAGQDVRTAPC